ncbi:MAG: sigma 54-interacting transcriptional regulator [Holophaga sp.]|nr:sigma 54-interacting transcriptional regulator [Holophaga sp.]
MKKVVVLSIGKRAGDVISAHLRRFFRGTVTVERYCREDRLDFAPDQVLALLSGAEAKNRPEMPALLQAGMECIVARRAIDYTRIQDLLALPAGTAVLLVNDYESSTRAVIEHLCRVGLDHLVYHPYYPGIPDYPRLRIAITPGEPTLVPPEVERVIDIGSRLVDISTIVELVQRLGLMDQLGDSISSQHLREITRLLREIDHAGQRVSHMRDTLQIMADYAPNGILYTDLDGRIILGNHTMATVLRMEAAEMTNRLVAELVPELPSMEALESSLVLTLGGQEMVVWAKPVQQGEAVTGLLYMFETSHSIQTLEHELRRKTRKSEHEARYTFHDILSRSPQMDRVLGYAKRVAQSDATILIQGETGTGKELFAQAIHNGSKRRQGPFVPVNFAAFPMSLLESELFGYEEGAFTGAKKGGRRGLFEEAHGGTIFLDEIGDAPLEFQVRLLRVLQERQVRPVGGRKLIPIDVRVIAATHKDLNLEVQQGRFRQDLFYRLSVVPLRMPSLRERREDIPLLVESFIERFSRGRQSRALDIMTRETFDHLCAYAWPGNIRQLMNLVEFLISTFEQGKLVQIEHLPEYLLQQVPAGAGGLLQDLLGPDQVWMLRIFREFGSIGRRHLAELAASQRPQLTEGVIRGLLLTSEALGLTRPGTGRKGSTLTEKGHRLTEQWDIGVTNG